MRRKFCDMLVVILTLLLIAVSTVVKPPIGVSVGIVDLDGESGGFVVQSGVDWWPMFRHDLSHTGYSTSEAPNTNNTIWNYTTGDIVCSSPAVADGKVYVGSDDNKVYCLNATTGAHIWNYTTGCCVSSSPAVADGKVYVGSYDDKVYCLNATTGAHIWNYTTGHIVCSSPAVADGKVYVGSYDNKVYCLNATTGAYVWSYTTGDMVSSSPAVADGKVYVGSSDGKVYCLLAPAGMEIWSYPTGSFVDSSPAVADGKVYVGSFDNKVYCLDASNGAYIWSRQIGGAVFSSPAVADGKVYVGSLETNKIDCLDASTGAYVWSYTTGDMVSSSPAVADGKVYVGSYDNKVYCLNATTGAYVWSYTTGDMVSSSPAVADGKVYVGSNDNKVYAFEDITLTITTTTGGTTHPPAGTHTYTTGSSVQVTAFPDVCYLFDHWELDGDDVGSANPYSVLMYSDHTLHAVFVQIGYTLTITTTTGGTTDPVPGAHTYECGSSVEVTAVPDIACVFDHWELDSSWNYSNPVSVMMHCNHTLHAAFTYNVTIEAHCYTDSVDVSVSITMDGSPTGYTTPHNFTGLTSTHTFTVPDTDPHSHQFKYWCTCEKGTTVTITSPGIYRACYGDAGPKWTFMVYLDADNDLEHQGIDEFLSMSSAGSTSDVNIVVQMDRWDLGDKRYGNWTECKRFYITQNMTPTPENATMNLGEVNMGDPLILRDFVLWTTQNFPADRYCLVLWDHGSGFMGFMYDFSHDDRLTLPELKQALGGFHFDVIGFDACLMGMIEVAYQMKDHTDYVVASEEVEMGYWIVDKGGWPYETILSNLEAHPWCVNGNELACTIVNEYGESWSTYPTSPLLTIAAVQTDSLHDVFVMNDFARTLSYNLRFYECQIRKCRREAEYYTFIASDNAWNTFVDLYRFAQLVEEQVPDTALQTAAHNVMVWLNATVIREWHYDSGGGHPNSHGLTIYFPKQDDIHRFYDPQYDSLDFSENTNWDEFLKLLASLEWRMFRHDIRHTGYSTSPAPRTNETLWSYQTGGPVTSSPAIVDGMVFVGSKDHNVYALDQYTGELIWSYQTNDSVESSPAVVDGVIYIGSDDGNVYALNESTGELIWNFQTGDAVRSSPTVIGYMASLAWVHNPVVYVGSADNNTYALNGDTGELIWNYTTGDSIYSSPAVLTEAAGCFMDQCWFNYEVFVGSLDGKVYCLDDYGNLEWDRSVGDHVFSSPTVIDNYVFVGSLNADNTGKLYALELWGYPRWTYEGTLGITSSPAVAEGFVFFGGFADHNVYALNESTGELIWGFTTGDKIFFSSPAIADGIVFIGSYDKNLYALDEFTGELVWKYKTDGIIDSSPAVANGIVFIGSNDGKIYAFGQPVIPSQPGIAITSVQPSETVVRQGEYLSVNVTIENEGDFIETFNVNAYYDNTPIGTKSITDLDPDTQQTLVFSWNTTGIAKGEYRISAEATPVPGETETTDNTKVDGIVTVFCSGHDVAIKNVASKTIVGQNYSLSIHITAKNYGNFTETFNVTTYYNTTIIQTKTVTNLPSGEETTVTFTWNTTGVAKGNYTITVKATQLPYETDLDDNTLTDGTILITYPGDANGDGKVRIDDILAIALAFGSNCGEPRYNPDYDINDDCKIRVDDILTAALNFGLG